MKNEPKLEYILVDNCRALKRNPQYMPEKKFRALVKSIKDEGFLSPILLRPEKNGRYEILAGNHRWLAAKEAGYKKIPAIIAKLNDVAAMKFAINSNTIHGAPNVELLAPFLADMADDILKEIHLDDTMLDEVCMFDETLKERLASFEIPDEVNRESSITSIKRCVCPKCGKSHIATAP